MITVTGAPRILLRLASAARAASRALPAALQTQTKRAGQLLAAVGANFINSWIWRSCCSDTGRSVHALRVRAAENSCSRAAGWRGVAMGVLCIQGLAKSQFATRVDGVLANIPRIWDYLSHL